MASSLDKSLNLSIKDCKILILEFNSSSIRWESFEKLMIFNSTQDPVMIFWE